MDIVPLTLERRTVWEKFCHDSDDAWFWHTPAWFEYSQNYRPEYQSENISFTVQEGGKILALCPLLLETKDGRKEISFGDSSGPLPALVTGLNTKKRQEVLKAAFFQVDQLAAKFQARRARFRSSVLNPNASEVVINPLTHFSYLDLSLASQVLDLTQTVTQLRSNMRHGHKSDISRAEKLLSVEVFDRVNILPEIFNQYVAIKTKVAGGSTRPPRTFEIMFELIAQGDNILVGVKKDDRFIGFAYFFVYKRRAYYGSACNDPDFKDLPVAHLSQWAAINWLKDQGCQLYELGWQVYGPSLSDYSSKKEIEISRFKRGFGGTAVPLWMGEKYYDVAYCQLMLNHRVDRLIKELKNHE